MDNATRILTPCERALWERATAHPFENPAVVLDFARRLARTMGWSLQTARAGIEEYRRFCFLAALATEPVTPSEEVDEIWHLHLTYSRDYWDVWCARVLGRALHHDPTAGGPVEHSRYRAQYAETLALYESYFGPPDARFWPGLQDRFRPLPRYQLVDRDRTIVLARPSLRALRAALIPGLAALLAVVSVKPASAAILDVLDWKGEQFLAFYAQLLLGAFTLAFAIRWLICSTGRPAVARNLSPVEVAYLKGGSLRAADTLVIGLSSCEAATVTTSPPRIRVSTARTNLPRDLQPFRSLDQGTFTRSQFKKMFERAPATQRMRIELADANLILDSGRNAWCMAATLLILVPVILLGVAKVVVGVGRDKPVGFLVMLLLVGLGVLIFTAFRQRRVTREGRATVVAMRRQNDRAVRAPRQHEVPLAFAFAGAAVLVGTEHAAYASMIRSASSSGGSGGGDGGSGCGCGGGGGGCGGCGS